MIVLPAIDLLGGNCVRLVRGAYVFFRLAPSCPQFQL